MVKQDQSKTRRESRFNQSPQVLITTEAMSQHDRGTAVDSGDPHIVACPHIHALILPPDRVLPSACAVDRRRLRERTAPRELSPAGRRRTERSGLTSSRTGRCSSL